ncbi:MAG TPA: cytidylate kinase-like family protein [Anaeromyxobacteraceae bacterium]|nr:cytidylate kinase-like family protein [Anaeromyxobacteraceae bacterium]
MISILTIEREYGCGGGDIAQRTAERLGWKLWDQLLTEEIARLAECPREVVRVREERPDPLYARLFKSFLRGSYEGSLNAHKLKVVDSERILRLTERVVKNVSGTGNAVIVGRGAQHFLRDHPGSLRIFLYAPRDAKVERLVAGGTSKDEAEQLVDTVDRERADFIRTYFHADWPARTLYHAMINTAVGVETVVKLILSLIQTIDAST